MLYGRKLSNLEFMLKDDSGLLKEQLSSAMYNLIFLIEFDRNGL